MLVGEYVLVCCTLLSVFVVHCWLTQHLRLTAPPKRETVMAAHAHSDLLRVRIVLGGGGRSYHPL